MEEVKDSGEIIPRFKLTGMIFDICKIIKDEHLTDVKDLRPRANADVRSYLPDICSRNKAHLWVKILADVGIGHINHPKVTPIGQIQVCSPVFPLRIWRECLGRKAAYLKRFAESKVEVKPASSVVGRTVQRVFTQKHEPKGGFLQEISLNPEHRKVGSLDIDLLIIFYVRSLIRYDIQDAQIKFSGFPGGSQAPYDRDLSAIFW